MQEHRTPDAGRTSVRHALQHGGQVSDHDGTEYEHVRLCAEFPRIAEQALAQFHREGNLALLPTLAVQNHQQVIEVNVRNVETECFTDTTSRIEQYEHEKMHSALVEALRSEPTSL